MVDFTNLARVSRQLPQPAPEVDDADLRVDPYGGQIMSAIYANTKQALGDEGTYYVVTNPTIGTGVAYALQTAFSDTASMFAIKNEDTRPVTAGGKCIILDSLSLMMTGTAPATTVNMDFAVKLDSKDRTPTAGSQTLTPVNVNGSINGAPNVTVTAFSAAAQTVPASGAGAKTVSRCRIPTSLGITGDVYCVQFGGTHDSTPGLTATRSTATAKLVTAAPPVVIPPGMWAVIYMWWATATTNAPNFEFELGFVVR